MIKLLSVISFGKVPTYSMTFKTLKISLGKKSIIEEVSCNTWFISYYSFFPPKPELLTNLHKKLHFPFPGGKNTKSS